MDLDVLAGDAAAWVGVHRIVPPVRWEGSLDEARKGS